MDQLLASQKFNLRDQHPNEKVCDYASDLQRLFKQAYPEGADSPVLLQRFLTGLKPPIAHQMLLKKNKPENLKDAIDGAITVEYALGFEGVNPLQ